MPLIVEVEDLERVKGELAAEDSSDVRKWWEYKCEECGHHVASDIHYSISLHCLKCGGDMPEVTLGI